MSILFENRDEFERGIALGLARAGKTVETPLAKLSLLASRRKFGQRLQRSDAQTSFQRSETSAFVPDAARKHLIRLVTGKDGSTTDAMARGAVLALKASGLSLHPFDFAKLEDFIIRYADDLGADARQWLSMLHPEKTFEDNIYTDAAVSEENLTQVSRAQRLQFLRDVRLRDPSRARTLIEGLMSGEQAETRLKYLTILTNGFSKDDKPFIDTLTSDRAPTVRELASKLLARLEGSDGHAQRVARLKDYFEIKTEGLLRRRKVIHYKGPGGKMDYERRKFINEALQDAGLSDFSTALAIDEATFVAMVLQNENDPVLKTWVVRMLLNDGNISLLKHHDSTIADIGPDALLPLLDERFGDLSATVQDAILQIIFDNNRWRSLPAPHVAQSLFNLLDRALPADMAQACLRSQSWQDQQDNVRPHYLDAWAPLVPPSHSGSYISLAEAHSHRATTYHRFLHALSQPI